MSNDGWQPPDDEVEYLIPDGLPGPVAAATIEVLYRVAEAMESRYLGEILRDQHPRNHFQLDLWD